MAATPESVLGLDVGDERVGVAVATLAARLPRPLSTLRRDGQFWPALQAVIADEKAAAVVVGLPRNLAGERTGQTEATEAFVAELRRRCRLPVHLQDEALTSRKAEAELVARGRAFRRADIDALAAVYILEDFLREQREPVS